MNYVCLQKHITPREGRAYSQYLNLLESLLKQRQKKKVSKPSETGNIKDDSSLTLNMPKEEKEFELELLVKRKIPKEPGVITRNQKSISKKHMKEISNNKSFDPISIKPSDHASTVLERLLSSELNNKSVKHNNIIRIPRGIKTEFLNQIKNRQLVRDFDLSTGKDGNEKPSPLQKSNEFKKDGFGARTEATKEEKMGRRNDKLNIFKKYSQSSTSQKEFSVAAEKNFDRLLHANSSHISMLDDDQEVMQSLSVNSSELHKQQLSYLKVCVSANYLGEAFSKLKYWEKKSSEKLDVELFNVILHGYSKKKDWNNIQNILSHMKKSGIDLNCQSYAAMLFCLGQLDHQDFCLKYTMIILNDLKSRGIDLNDLFVKTKLANDQYEVILRQVNLVEPSFIPKPQELDLNYYNCSLLDNLPSSSSYKSPAAGVVTSKELRKLLQEQFDIEWASIVKIKSVEKGKFNDNLIVLYRKRLQDMFETWKKALESALSKEKLALKMRSERQKNSTFSLYPYLDSIPAKDIVRILFLVAKRHAEGSENYSYTTSQLCRLIGSMVATRYNIRSQMKDGEIDKKLKLLQKYCSWYVNPDNKAKNPRESWLTLLQNNPEGPHLTCEGRDWPDPIKEKIGRFLFKILIENIKVDVNVNVLHSFAKPRFLPAFYQVLRNRERHTLLELKPHPALPRLFRAAANDYLDFEVYEVPMVCPPLPWTNQFSGGYVAHQDKLIRVYSPLTAHLSILNLENENQINPIFDSLNQLGAVPWTINEEVLDVALKVFRNGGSEKLDVAVQPSTCIIAPKGTPSMSKLERYQALLERKASLKKKTELNSLWHDALYKFSIANHFRKKIFWLPYNMDFRGRVYPIPPHSTHISADVFRAFMCFAKREPLGPKGLDWLKIHTINLCGTHKKKSLDERLAYANEILPSILDSAERPLTGDMWWTQSDEPWQTLAACMEIKNALKSGNPEQFLSKFPVHQDGSCNGLQHYAALGRDLAGGKSVNLTDTNLPEDVYSEVVEGVERERKKDAAEDVKIALALEGRIKRKIIKQTVMTSVYGVTNFGARLQIARQLKELSEFPEEFVQPASLYLVGKTFFVLREMFSSARDIQEWFTLCASIISRTRGECVEWITPLGLPVLQPYLKTAKKGNKRVFVPNTLKQKNAFPPNYVHSLDSTHMMLTSIFCENEGMTFSSIHDCFWTHANQVDKMNKICREQFVAIHQKPLLEDLSHLFVERFGASNNSDRSSKRADNSTKNNRVFKNIPEKGSLDLNEILKSKYFFS